MRRPGRTGLDRQRDFGQRPLAGDAATLGVADLVAGLDPQRLLPGLGPGGDPKRDAPGDLILEVLDELEIREDLLLLADRGSRRGPLARDLQARGVEEVELGILRAILGRFLRVLIDMEPGPSLAVT